MRMACARRSYAALARDNVHGSVLLVIKPLRKLMALWLEAIPTVCSLLTGSEANPWQAPREGKNGREDQPGNPLPHDGRNQGEGYAARNDCSLVSTSNRLQVQASSSQHARESRSCASTVECRHLCAWVLLARTLRMSVPPPTTCASA